MFIKSRREFLKNSSVIVGGLAVQHLISRVPLSLVVAQSITSLRRPLRMLAIGDSVMWGQGLLEQNKFSYIVRDELCKRRNGAQCANKEDVQIYVTAHSGANIFEKQEDDQLFLRTNTPRVYSGEVNFPNPTIPGQIDLAARHYQSQSISLAEVDLILVNGGINDMNNSILLIPRVFRSSVEFYANLYCGEKMKELLGSLAQKFPNARMVVPSYFPLISDQTPATTVLSILKMALTGVPGEAERLYRIQEARAFRLLRGIPDNVQHPIRHYLANRSEKWATASSAALRGAVNSINADRPLTPIRAGASTQRAWFVQVPFGPERAYGTNSTYLWKLVDRRREAECARGGIAGNLESNDELFPKRACMCEVACKENDITCVRAGFMHPNKQGARAYADSIIDVLRTEILPNTNWL